MGFLRPAVCAMILVLACAGSAFGQSLSHVVSQAGRAVSKTFKQTERAISRSVQDLSSDKSKKRSGAPAQQAFAPPLPERKPRAWAKSERGPAQTAQAKSRPAPAQPAKGTPSRAVKPSQPVKRTASKPKVAESRSAARTNSQASKTPPPTRAAEVPEPVDEWSEVETNIARARCSHLLKQVDAVVFSQPPMKKGPCGDAAPVKLVALGTSPKVSVSPPAIVNCEMVHALYTWLEKDLQPLARKHLGSPIVTIENMSSYSCRNAYGRKNGRLSEHGRANALDIRGFKTAKGKAARLLAHWGPAQRDIVAAKKKAAAVARAAAEKEKAARAAAAKAKAKGGTASRGATKTQAVARPASSGDRSGPVSPEQRGRAKSASLGVPLPVRGTIIEGMPESGSASRVQRGGRGSDSEGRLGLTPSRLGGPDNKKKTSKQKSGTRAAPSTVVKIPRVSQTPKAKFLRAAHKSACRLFGTTLGPEANEAHRNHFHVDLAERKYRNYCE